MPNEFDLLNPAVISQIISETDKSEEKERRRYSFNSYQIYSGNLEPYVRTELSRTRPKSFSHYTLSDISLSAMITDKRAQSYNESPIRTVDGNEKKTEALDAVYEEADGDTQLEFFDRIFNLNRYALMWVNNLKDKYQFLTLHPYEAIIVRDKDTGELQVVALNYPNRELTNDAQASTNGLNAVNGDGISDLIAESQSDGAAQGDVWVFWTKDQHVKVKVETSPAMVNGSKVLQKNINYIPIPDNPNGINPLGILPFVFKSTDTSVDYPVLNPLTNQTIKFNVQQSETLTSKNIHGSGIQVFKFPEKFQGKFDRITHGQLGAVELPQSSDPDDGETDFDYKTSGAQLAPMKESDFAYLEQVAKQHGLENFQIDSGSVDVMNGVSRAISGASVQKIIGKNQKCYAKLERDMFNIIKAWDKFLGKNEFSAEDGLSVVFQKPKVMVSDKETLENIEKMLELGLIEEHEKFIKMDPNLSEEDAREKLKRIDDRRMEKVMKFTGGMDADKQDGINKESEPKPKGPDFGPERKG
jgi:hypothetical protein